MNLIYSTEQRLPEGMGTSDVLKVLKIARAVYTYQAGLNLQLWTLTKSFESNIPLHISHMIVDTFFSQPSYLVRDLTPYTSLLSIEHNQREYTVLLFLQHGCSPFLSLRYALDQTSFFHTNTPR